MPTIEVLYVRMRQTHRRVNLFALWSQAKRATLRLDNMVKLQSRNRARRRETLTRAASQMHPDDLDSALVAALRGDHDQALARMADHVSTRARERSGTPWRMTGWLSKR